MKQLEDNDVQKKEKVDIAPVTGKTIFLKLFFLFFLIFKK